MSHHIAFISSDSKPLYKLDIFHLTTFPSGYIFQFRYDPQYVADNIKEDCRSMIGQEGVVYFLYGNDVSIDIEQRNLELVPVRKITVKDCYYDEYTSLYIFHLEAKDFVTFDCESCGADRAVIDDFKNSGHVVSMKDLGFKDINWSESVSLLKKYFRETVFFNFDLFDGNEENVEITCDKVYNCRFTIFEERRYTFHVNLIDGTNDTSGKFMLDLISEYATLTFPKEYNVRCKKDKRKVSVVVHSVEKESNPAVLKVSSTYDGTLNNELNIEMNIKHSSRKCWYYGLFSVGISFAVIMGQVIASLQSCIDGKILLGFFLSSVFGLLSGLMYKIFRKQ